MLLSSVSLKLIKIKIKLTYATTSLCEKNKMAGESQVIPTDFIFLFIIRVVFFMIRVQFYFIFVFLFDLSWSESIRVDPVRLFYLPIQSRWPKQKCKWTKEYLFFFIRVLFGLI